ncbi:DMT family transporter [Devosia sp.]|uniref:DMT family transporter n=1 Tax=Devosia sp. TaxID=1871048 RepID=UPI0025DB09CA|nr:DMT family transporter [Devosia sp.]MCR6633895.1 DMT family transporter [Devosia sp.]
MRIIVLTVLALVAFAANSVLARLALASPAIDAAGFTGVRLASGAVVLGLLLWFRNGSPRALVQLTGTWAQSAALFGYAICFSFAYNLLGASMGALILFASVQIGMVARAVSAGDRPAPLEWIGLVAAAGAFVYLVSPGLAAPHPLGAALMILAGLCWAGYSLLGRGSSQPLSDTAGNFMRCLPLAVLLIIVGVWTGAPRLEGIILAVASGALASGLGYAIWYAALPHLSRTRAAVVQLSVPVIAGFGAVVFIGEALTPRLLIASAVILGGIAVAIVMAGRRRSA